MECPDYNCGCPDYNYDVLTIIVVVLIMIVVVLLDILKYNLRCPDFNFGRPDYNYWVATMSRLLKFIGLFCKRAIQKRRYSAKETCNFLNKPAPSRPDYNNGCPTTNDEVD